MKKILLILLIFATSAMATDYAYFREKFSIGLEAWAPTSYTIRLVGYSSGSAYDTISSFTKSDNTDTIVSGTFSSNILDTLRELWWDINLVDTAKDIDFSYIRPLVGMANFISIGTPSAANTCRCYGFAYHSGQPAEGAIVSATLKGNNVKDTCNNTTWVNYTVTSQPSDSNGYYYVDLPWTACMSAGNKYHLKLDYQGHTDYEDRNYTVPSLDSILIEN